RAESVDNIGDPLSEFRHIPIKDALCRLVPLFQRQENRSSVRLLYCRRVLPERTLRHNAHLFLRHANERARGGIPLKTTAPAARAELSVLMEDDVPDLRARTAEALKKLSAENDAAADARSERQKDTARILPAGAIARLAERRRVGIVQNKGLFARIFLHERR